jgi:opacity protein-like surface antigen
MKKLLLISFLVFLAMPAFALTGVSFGLRGGLVTNFDQPTFATPGYESSAMPIGGLHVRISTLPMFDLIVTGEYAWKKNSYSWSGEELAISQRDLLFSASVVYPIKLKPISPYAGVGIARHSLGYDYTEPSGWSLSTYGVEVPENTTKTGYHLLGGVDLKVPMFPLSFSAEFRMNWINTPEETTKYNSFVAGLNFSLP